MKNLPRNKEYIEANKRSVLEWLDVDVDTEYELIQNRQSKLSVSQREQVIDVVTKRNEVIKEMSEAVSGE